MNKNVLAFQAKDAIRRQTYGYHQSGCAGLRLSVLMVTTPFFKNKNKILNSWSLLLLYRVELSWFLIGLHT